MRISFRVIFAVISFLIIVFFTTNFFVSKKVKTLLDKEENLSYSSFSSNAFTGNLSLKDINFNEVDKIIQIKTIAINIDILHYLLNSEIIIESIDAEELDLHLNSSPDLKSKKTNKIEIVGIEKINLENANITFENKNNVIFEMSKLNLYAEDINLPLDKNYEWLNNESIAIDAKNLSYSMDTLHDLKSEDFRFTNQSLSFENFSIEPKFTKSEYINHIDREKDLMNLKSKSLKISGFKLQKIDSLLHISSRKIQIDFTDFNIYRDKTIADDTSYKPLYSQALRELDFQLSIDSLLISELDLTYQELIDIERNAGEIKFNSIHAQAFNIHNTLNAERPEITLKAEAKFTESSKILFDLNFVPDHEQFYVSTHLKHVEDKSINGFFAPAIRMEMEGSIEEIKTSIYGNNTKMDGDFSIAYKKLKLNVLRKNGSKNSFASLLSNAFIRNKDVDETLQLENIERHTTKSFWNYVWTFHMQGLKKSLL